MKCTYGMKSSKGSNGCLHYKEDGHCDMETCYDEYSMGNGEPFPNVEVEAYWVGLIGRAKVDEYKKGMK